MRTARPLVFGLPASVLLGFTGISAPAHAASEPEIRSALLTAPEAIRATHYGGTLDMDDVVCDSSSDCGRVWNVVFPDAFHPKDVSISFPASTSMDQEIAHVKSTDFGVAKVVSTNATTVVWLWKVNGRLAGIATKVQRNLRVNVSCVGATSSRDAVLRCARRLLKAQWEKAGRVR